MNTLRYAFTNSTFGRLLVACTPVGLCAVLPGDDDDGLVSDLRRRFRGWDLVFDGAAVGPYLHPVQSAIDAGTGFDLPIDLVGTEFSRAVWAVLQTIPPGQTLTYAQVAHRAGRPKAVRAVGQACKNNPLAVVVPCHRVLPTHGGLGGYRWGVDRKEALLSRERTQ